MGFPTIYRRGTAEIFATRGVAYTRRYDGFGPLTERVFLEGVESNKRREDASMPQRTTPLTYLVLVALGSAALWGQTGGPANPSAEPEFPVTLQQTITSGKTPVGTKVQAKLAIATLVNGTVIPRNAVLSGEVIESVAKTATNPARLAVRMDSAQWKSGSADVKVYLTRWYYPTQDATGQNLQYGPSQSPNRNWDGKGQYPDPNSKVYRPFPGSDSDKGSSVPDTPSSATSNHRILMKDMESVSANDGAMAIVSKRSNIKLDKLTTYVLATSEVLPAK